MMILFETDYQSGEKGFSATYTSNENSVCGGLVSIPATASADIKSPDYPSDYPPSTECKWLVDSHQTYNTTFKVTGLTLIGKFWKTHPEIFPKFQFSEV